MFPVWYMSSVLLGLEIGCHLCYRIDLHNNLVLQCWQKSYSVHDPFWSLLFSAWTPEPILVSSDWRTPCKM